MRIKNVNKHIDSLRLPPNNPQLRTTQFEKRKKKKKKHEGMGAVYINC